MIRQLALLALFCTICMNALNDNCNGSGRCNKNMQGACTAAFNRYNSNTQYSGYTSRTNQNCAAMYRCNGDYPSLSGAQLKELFQQIYNNGCKGCGSKAFNNGNCEVTVNFCSKCQDSGNPN